MGRRVLLMQLGLLLRLLCVAVQLHGATGNSAQCNGRATTPHGAPCRCEADCHACCGSLVSSTEAAAVGSLLPPPQRCRTEDCMHACSLGLALFLVHAHRASRHLVSLRRQPYVRLLPFLLSDSRGLSLTLPLAHPLTHTRVRTHPPRLPLVALDAGWTHACAHPRAPCRTRC